MTSPREPSAEEPHEHHDDDEVFRQIVAGFGEEVDEAVPRWPVSEDLSEPLSATTTTDEPGYAGPEAPEQDLPGWLEPPALEDDGHYVPPPPPRLPRIRLRTVGAIVLLLMGLVALLLPYQVGLDDSVGSLVLGMMLVVGGGLLLITSMRDAPGSDDRPDDGAVV